MMDDVEPQMLQDIDMTHSSKKADYKLYLQRYPTISYDWFEKHVKNVTRTVKIEKEGNEHDNYLYILRDICV